MQTKEIGTKHGAAVRRMASFAADIVVALRKDVALNLQRVSGYVAGFAQGLRRAGNA